MAIKKGDTCRVRVPVIQGTVLRRQVDEGSDQVLVLMTWTDAAGQEQQRWFDEAELEAVNEG